MKNKPYIVFLGAILFLSLNSCNKEWKDYYAEDVSYTQAKILDVLKDSTQYSIFLDMLHITGYDSILSRQQSYTLFIPDNDAMSSFSFVDRDTNAIIGYHVAPSILMTHNIKGTRKLEAYIKKFLTLQRNEEGVLVDNIPASWNSKLFEDGVYYNVQDILTPQPNIYEYYSMVTPAIKDYIDQRDSFYLDYTNSIPIDFDSLGNTVYDSVYEVVNLFEEEYFPVKQEFREKTATFLLFSQEQYNDALDRMAEKFDFINDHNDIPKDWINEVFIPFNMERGIFKGRLNYNELAKERLKNIKGDSVFLDITNIDPNSQNETSNGRTFQYIEFQIPDTLYLDTIKFEGESLLVPLGLNNYEWHEDVTVSDYSFTPEVLSSAGASSGSIINITLERRYSKKYWFEFSIPRVFPSKYIFRWYATYRPSGVISFWVNDEKIGEVDNFLFSQRIDGHKPVAGINYKDFELNNLTEYGTVKIRVQYEESGTLTNNGINIDVIWLIPQTE